MYIYISMHSKLELWTLCLGLEIKLFKQYDKKDVLFFHILQRVYQQSHEKACFCELSSLICLEKYNLESWSKW